MSLTRSRLVVLVLLGALVGLVACQTPRDASDGAPRYVTTIAPFAMILEPIVDGRGSVVRLLDPGASPHTHDLRPSDLRLAEGSAAVVYGAESLDAWAADLPAPRRFELMAMLPERVRLPFDPSGAVVRGDAPDPGAPEGPDPRDRHEAHGGHDPGQIDPHFWTDPEAVKALLPALTDSLCAVDAPGCATYRANADTFATRLDALDAQVSATLAPVRDVPVMTAQPFFGYFLRRYGPSLRGVVEPQPAKEPSPRQIAARVATARRDSVRAIFVQRQLPPRAAEAVAEAAQIPIHTLDPLGGVAGRTSYADLLLYNADVIHRALTDSAAGS